MSSGVSVGRGSSSAWVIDSCSRNQNRHSSTPFNWSAPPVYEDQYTAIPPPYTAISPPYTAISPFKAPPPPYTAISSYKAPINKRGIFGEIVDWCVDFLLCRKKHDITNSVHFDE